MTWRDFRKQTRRRARRWRRAVEYRALKALGMSLWPLVQSAPETVIRAGGALGFLSLAETRGVIERNLTLVYGPELTPGEIRCMARANLYHMAANFVEWLEMLRARPPLTPRVRYEGREHVEAALSGGRGVIAISAHLGNWELLAAFMRECGYPVNVVARRMHASEAEDSLADLRAGYGVKVLDRSASARDLLRCLHRKEGVAILMDQDTKVSGAMVDFLGHPAWTPTGPAALACVSGAPILPIFTRREAPGRHVVFAHPLFYADPAAAREAEVLRLTERCNREIGAAIRSAPTQWMWLHRRWRIDYPGRSQATWERHAARRERGRAERVPSRGAGAPRPSDEGKARP